MADPSVPRHIPRLSVSEVGEAEWSPHPSAGNLTPATEAFVQRLLRCCGQRPPASADLSELYDLGCQLSPEEWEEVAAFTRDQGMQSLLLAQAEAAGLLSALPGNVSQSLYAAYSACWIGNRRLRGHLLRILSTLRANGIQAMPIKGIWLAERCYGELALRPITDLDLLVHRQDLERVDRLMVTLGYRSLPGKDDPHDFYGLTHQTAEYYRPDGELVEVHWELTVRPAYLLSLPARDLWRRSTWVDFATERVPALSPADELRYLCFHYAAQHQSARLIWLVDIARLASLLTCDWNWASFVAETIALGLATPVAVALQRAQAQLGVTLPEGVLTDLWKAAAARHEHEAWASAATVWLHPPTLLRYILVQPSTKDRLLLVRAVILLAAERLRRRAGAWLSRFQRLEISARRTP